MSVTLAAVTQSAKLAADYHVGDGQMTMESGRAGIWPAPSAGSPLYLVVVTPGTNPAVQSAYKVTGRTGDVLTVAIQEGQDQFYPIGSTVLLADGGGGGSAISSLTGDVTASGIGSVAATFVGQTNAITPAISSQTNDWAPTGLATANVIRVTVSAYANLTGLTGGADGRIITLQNATASTFPLRLDDQSTSSLAANRFSLSGASIFLAPGESIALQYHSASNLWHELSGHKDVGTAYFGSGKDGAVTISSGTTTLTRDMYYRTLTLSGTGVLNPSGWRIFVSELLDLSAAQSGAIVWSPNNGGAGGNTGTAGTAGVAIGAQTVAGGRGGGAGGAGATSNGSPGGAGGAAVTNFGTNGGAGGASGGGGAGGTGSAGAFGAAGAATPVPVWGYQNTQLPGPGCGGGGGGGGGGDGTNSGSGGGGGGSGGNTVFIAARYISRGTNSNASIVQVLGGNGAVGGAQTTGNTGGGGGGAGGGGGWIYIAYGALLGTQIANALDTSGGSGGNGGNLHGTGANGVGGQSGRGGRMTLVNVTAGITTETDNTANFNSNSGQTGGGAFSSKVAL